MKAPSPHQFDTKGFVFFLKLTPFLLVLAFFFHTGSEAIMAQYFPKGNALAMAAESAQITKIKSLETQKTKLEKIKAKEEAFLSTQVIKGQTIESVIPEEGRFIGVDLVNMKVMLYKNGEIVDTLPVLSKGEPGSHWETPSGVYEIKMKERRHLSSITNTYLPYSMQFFGNFFIHGWPYYPGGEPVPEGFSGGCVRLSTEDAKTIYEFARVGTGLFVYEGRDEGAPKSFVRVNSESAPETTAWSYLVADIETGQVYAAKNTEKQHPIASVTKLMTAIVANETIRFDSPVSITDSGVYVGEGGGVPDEKLLIGELLYPLILESNNQTAQAIAKYYYAGKEVFLERMNDKAAAIGMDETRFEDASGLSRENISTAKDLYHLAKYVYDVKSFILHISRQEARSITSSAGEEYIFHNKTHFLDRENYLGGKIGYTPAARETMIAFFEVEMNNEEHVVTFIVLGAQERKDAILALLEWLKDSTGSF